MNISSSNECSWVISLRTMVLSEVTKKLLKKQRYCRRIYLLLWTTWSVFYLCRRTVRNTICLAVWSNSMYRVLERREAITVAAVSIGKVCIYASNFERSLYHEKHAFYFRKVKKWVICLWVSKSIVMPSRGCSLHTDVVRMECLKSWVRIEATYLKWEKLKRPRNLGLLGGSRVVCRLRYVYGDLLSGLEEVMIGVSKSSEKLKILGEKADAGSVVKELRMFGKECK